mmetsp:Transcript_38552/g.34271  ORF Transcript_38552/g.34271 Transcript_38552/m.34271 type:complete len:164 (-) Transcript_38552:38-529(-)
MNTPVNIMSNSWYIKVFELHNLLNSDQPTAGDIYEETEKVILDANIPANFKFLKENGLYLLDDNDTIYIYVKKGCDPVLLNELFGVESFEELEQSPYFPEGLETTLFYKVNNIIDALRKLKNSSYQSVRVVLENGPMEIFMTTLLYENSDDKDHYPLFLHNIY